MKKIEDGENGLEEGEDSEEEEKVGVVGREEGGGVEGGEGLVD